MCISKIKRDITTFNSQNTTEKLFEVFVESTQSTGVDKLLVSSSMYVCVTKWEH